MMSGVSEATSTSAVSARRNRTITCLGYGPRFNLCQKVVDALGGVPISLPSVPTTRSEALEFVECVPDRSVAMIAQPAHHSLVIVQVSAVMAERTRGDRVNCDSERKLDVGSDVGNGIEFGSCSANLVDGFAMSLFVRGASSPMVMS